jgi:hypothetical protein
LKPKDAKKWQKQGKRNIKKWGCFASFSQNSKKVIHMQKRNEAKKVNLKRTVSEKSKSGRKRVK